ncbi:MAG: radical SAM protein [Myxococcales bacterium]|nr:radical SAM protein [Myxococcales bacterium]
MGRWRDSGIGDFGSHAARDGGCQRANTDARPDGRALRGARSLEGRSADGALAERLRSGGAGGEAEPGVGRAGAAPGDGVGPLPAHHQPDRDARRHGARPRRSRSAAAGHHDDDRTDWKCQGQLDRTYRVPAGWFLPAFVAGAQFRSRRRRGHRGVRRQGIGHAPRVALRVGTVTHATVPALEGSAAVQAPDERPFRVTDACAAHCVFCAEHVPRRTPDLATDAVLDRLRQALVREVPRRLVLTGGEPTLHPRLPRLVAMARQFGCAEVEVETLGLPLVDPTRVQRLADAGLTRVRLTLLATDDTAAERLTRTAGVVTAQRTVLGHLAAAGLAITAQTPVHQGTVAELEALAGFVASTAIRRWRWQPYVADGPAAPRDLHLDTRAVEAVLRRAFASAQAAGIDVAPPPGRGWHWCAFSPAVQLGGLSVPTSAGGHVHVPACAECVVRTTCPGVERSLADHRGDAAVAPIRDARRAAWLPVHGGGRDAGVGTGGHQRHDLLPIARATDALPGMSAPRAAEPVHELVLRIVHACNQRCGFCWVDFDQPAMTLTDIVARIEAARVAGRAPRIAFTGGEPTLHPQLAEAVRVARELGAPAVTLQTNAARIDATLAQALATAGLTDALVSLHSADAAVSDALTAAPGTWQRSVAGIGALCAAGIEVKLNHVLTRQTGPAFASFVAFVADHLAHPRLQVSVAVAGHIDAGPLDPGLLPTHTELGPHVAAGLHLARARGVRMVGLTHPCGVVPCTVPDPLAAFAGHTLGAPAEDAGRLRDGGVKVPACRECAFDKVCFGVRQEYSSRHGIAELVPVRAAAWEP